MKRNLTVLIYIIFVFIVIPKNVYTLIFLDEEMIPLKHRNSNQIFKSNIDNKEVENFDQQLKQLSEITKQVVSQDLMLIIMQFLPSRKTMQLKVLNKELLGYISKAMKLEYLSIDQDLFDISANKALTIEKEYFGTYGYLESNPDVNPFRMYGKDKQIMMLLKPIY